MRHYKAGNIATWKKYKNEQITFQAAHSHSIHMKVIGNGNFSVWAESENTEKTLIGTGTEEVIQVSMTIDEPTTVSVTGSKDVYIWTPEGQGPTQRVFPDENFVSLEPKKNYSPELYAIELKMRENMLKMTNLLNAEREARKLAQAEKDAIIEVFDEPEATETPAEE